MSAFMDALLHFGETHVTGVLIGAKWSGQSDSIVHITPYSIYSKTDLFLINILLFRQNYNVKNRSTIVTD